MKPEKPKDSETNDHYFCWSCGKHLCARDEIARRICHDCEKAKQSSHEEIFFCWACGERLLEMSEVAQGLCMHCKASIIRKINKP